MPNIQKVAKLAGVSVATVSRVINNPNIVTDKTRQRVQSVIEQLNYSPSVHGRNLRTAESRLLLILIPSISNPFYTDIIHGIQQEATKHRYNILLSETDFDPAKKDSYLNLLRNQLADGIISMDPTVNSKRLIELSKSFPVVQCSEYDRNSTLSYVSINNELAAFDAVKYLIEKGHREIALINSDTKYLYARERLKGYKRAIKEYDLEYDSKFIYSTNDLSFGKGQTALKSLLELGVKPTAIFCVSDVLAIGVLKEAQNLGLKVPDDIAIVGFDKIDFTNYTHPTLTTISQPKYKLGIESAKMLINKIKGNDVKSVILNHELVIRDST